MRIEKNADTRIVLVPDGVGLDVILENLFLAAGSARWEYDMKKSRFVDVTITITSAQATVTITAKSAYVVASDKQGTASIA